MKWKYCEQCKKWYYVTPLTVNRCPHCGARMEDEQSKV